jgi:hypothetical protein
MKRSRHACCRCDDRYSERAEQRDARPESQCDARRQCFLKSPTHPANHESNQERNRCQRHELQSPEKHPVTAHLDAQRRGRAASKRRSRLLVGRPEGASSIRLLDGMHHHLGYGPNTSHAHTARSCRLMPWAIERVDLKPLWQSLESEFLRGQSALFAYGICDWRSFTFLPNEQAAQTVLALPLHQRFAAGGHCNCPDGT